MISGGCARRYLVQSIDRYYKGTLTKLFVTDKQKFRKEHKVTPYSSDQTALKQKKHTEALQCLT